MAPAHHLVRSLTMCLVIIVGSSGPVAAEPNEPAFLIIRNVTVIDGRGETEDVTVDIRITKGELVLVSRDRIPSEEDYVVVNAGGDYLIGNLVLSRPPSFLILDEDPRVNFDALLDTEEHITFAIRNGVVVINNLSPPEEPEVELAEERPSRWFAYTPPPISLPLDYASGSKWNAWQGKAVSGAVFGAVALDRTRWLAQDAVNIEQVGDLAAFAGGEIRALRVGAGGTLSRARRSSRASKRNRNGVTVWTPPVSRRCLSYATSNRRARRR